MSKQTAMQQLIAELKSSNTVLSNLIALGLCEKYLAIEKQQIVEAAKFVPAVSTSEENIKSAEQYYSQTYKQ